MKVSRQFVGISAVAVATLPLLIGAFGQQPGATVSTGAAFRADVDDATAQGIQQDSTAESPDADDVSNAPGDSTWGHLKGRFVLSGSLPRDERERTGRSSSLVVSPESRGIANVLVYVRANDIEVYPDDLTVASSLTLTLSEGRIGGGVRAVRAGQRIIVKNEDNTAHNLNIQAILNPPRNLVLSPGETEELSFDRAEQRPLLISDAIHPWERNWLLIANHPYAAVTDKDGAFEIRNLPVGELEIQCWHERTGWLSARPDWANGRFSITITAGRTHDIGEVQVAANLFVQERTQTGDDVPLP